MIYVSWHRTFSWFIGFFFFGWIHVLVKPKLGRNPRSAYHSKLTIYEGMGKWEPMPSRARADAPGVLHRIIIRGEESVKE